MIVIAAKVSVRKILACVLAAGTVLTGAAVLLPADAQPAAAASENMRLDVKLRTNEQRVALLRDCGWEVIEEPRGEREVQIPEEFDEVYESYNQIQLAQGLDLTPCRGRRATLYTYEITNHPSGEQGVTANLLVRRGKLIRPMYPRRRQTASCTVCASIRPNRRIPPDRPPTKCTTAGNLCNSTKTCSTY